MISVVQNWFATRANPIGVDFSGDCLRMAQVQVTKTGERRLIAAASAEVPERIRHDADACAAFFAESSRELLARGRFVGRHAVLTLPASSLFIRHLRVAHMDDDSLRKALPWEARGKLPMDPNAAVLRHVIAGDVYRDQEPQKEVILMATSRAGVNQYLAAAARARLDVVGMNVEPAALIDCFAHVYRRKADAETTSCYVNIGNTATRAVIARGSQISFARNIPIGGEHFTRAVADAMKITAGEARTLRMKLCDGRSQFDGPVATAYNAETCLDGQTQASEIPIVDTATNNPARLIEQACQEPLNRLIDELTSCRDYYEATFANRPVDCLIFVGNEARQRWLCQRIAQRMSLAAQVGDPFVRMGGVGEAGLEIGRQQSQPGWAIAIGSSLGPVVSAAAEWDSKGDPCQRGWQQAQGRDRRRRREARADGSGQNQPPAEWASARQPSVCLAS